MKKAILLILILNISITIDLICQNDWQWGYQGTNNNYCATEIGAIDRINNVYSIYPYDSTIVFQDTMFSHIGNFLYHPNFAIVKLDSEGAFLNALDFHIQSGNLFEHYVTIDNDLNLYVIIRFKGIFSVNGSVFSNKSTSTDLVLLKFNSQFELLWDKYIYSPSADYCHGMFLTKSNNIYIYTEHYGSGFQEYEVNYFNQDTSYFSNTTMSFMKIDIDGNILWRKELVSTGPALFGGESNIGEDGNFYVIGSTEDTLFIDGDTAILPTPTIYPNYAFVVGIRPDGFIQRVYISEKRVFFPRHVDSECSYYFNMFVYDTIVLGSDTLISSDGNYISVIGKMDSLYNTIWYEKLEFSVMTGYSFTFRTVLKNDTLYFVSNCFGSFEFADSAYNLSNNESILYGQFSSEGDLISSDTAAASSKVVARDIAVDNCSNSYISGYFHGVFEIGNDTIIQDTPLLDDGFITKVSDNRFSNIDLGKDTTIAKSESIELTIPYNYTNIIWSTGETTNSIKIYGNALQEGVNNIWVNGYQGNCFATDTILIFVIDDSVIPENKNSVVYFYPNPATNTLNFYSKSGLNLYNVTFFNQLGKVVLQQKTPANKIDLKNLESGIYIIEFEYNQKITRQKIVVRK